MAINFDEIRKKLNKLSGQSARGASKWKVPEGVESTVRLLSFPDNDGQPFKELWFYFNIGDNMPLLAPYQFGRPDPIRELINKLRDDNTEESNALAKKLYPKMRAYAPVIVRGEEDKGVRLWAFSKQVYQSLLNIMLDEDYGDITDPKTGRDIKVTSSKANGRSYPTTEVMARGKSSPLSESADKAKQWLANIPSPSESQDEKSYEELEKIVNDWINGDVTSSSSEMGTRRGEDTSTHRTARPMNEDAPRAKAKSDDESDESPKTRTQSKVVETPKTKSSGKPEGKFKDLEAAFSELED